jgi:glutamate carboxypeptidase
VIAEESRAVVDVRVRSAKDARWIEKEILSLKPQNKESEVFVEGYFGRPPMERTPRNKRLWSLARDMGELLGLDLEQAAAGGGSDGNTTSQYTATLDGLGTTGDGAHARHEHIVTEKLLERTALLTLLVMADSLKSGGTPSKWMEQKEESPTK